MNAPAHVRTFNFDAARVQVDRSGAALVSSLMPAPQAHPNPPAVDPDGVYTLGAYFIAGKEDVHPGLWEIHPGGDEVFLLCSGALDVVTRVDGTDATTTLDAGQGLVVPRAVWHRLALRKPGLLIVLVPRAGTRLCPAPA